MGRCSAISCGGLSSAHAAVRAHSGRGAARAARAITRRGDDRTRSAGRARHRGAIGDDTDGSGTFGRPGVGAQSGTWCWICSKRFCHPYSDIDSLFPPGTTGTATKQITVEEALALTALPDEESAVASQILKSASISGFSLIWSKALTVAAGIPSALCGWIAWWSSRCRCRRGLAPRSRAFACSP